MTTAVMQKSNIVDQEKGDAFYDKHYADGGWEYSRWREYLWHRKHLVKHFRIARGARMLEIACGTGFHTNLFNRMGFHCVGIDRSESGIECARKRYPRRAFHHCDFRDVPFPDNSFDVVVARGFSFYHYDLASYEAHEATRTLLRYLKPGGMFAMLIVTDLSGAREEGCVWQNTLDDYEAHFSSFGMKWSVDWAEGMAICGLFKPN